MRPVSPTGAPPFVPRSARVDEGAGPGQAKPPQNLETLADAFERVRASRRTEPVPALRAAPPPQSSRPPRQLSISARSYVAGLAVSVRHPTDGKAVRFIEIQGDVQEKRRAGTVTVTVDGRPTFAAVPAAASVRQVATAVAESIRARRGMHNAEVVKGGSDALATVRVSLFAIAPLPPPPARPTLPAPAAESVTDLPPKRTLQAPGVAQAATAKLPRSS